MKELTLSVNTDGDFSFGEFVTYDDRGDYYDPDYSEQETVIISGETVEEVIEKTLDTLVNVANTFTKKDYAMKSNSWCVEKTFVILSVYLEMQKKFKDLEWEDKLIKDIDFDKYPQMLPKRKSYFDEQRCYYEQVFDTQMAEILYKVNELRLLGIMNFEFGNSSVAVSIEDMKNTPEAYKEIKNIIIEKKLNPKDVLRWLSRM